MEDLIEALPQDDLWDVPVSLVGLAHIHNVVLSAARFHLNYFQGLRNTNLLL